MASSFAPNSLKATVSRKALRLSMISFLHVTGVPVSTHPDTPEQPCCPNVGKHLGRLRLRVAVQRPQQYAGGADRQEYVKQTHCVVAALVHAVDPQQAESQQKQAGQQVGDQQQVRCDESHHGEASGPGLPPPNLLRSCSSPSGTMVCAPMPQATRPPARPTRNRSYCKPRNEPVMVMVPTAIALPPATALDVGSGIDPPKRKSPRAAGKVIKLVRSSCRRCRPVDRAGVAGLLGDPVQGDAVLLPGRQCRLFSVRGLTEVDRILQRCHGICRRRQQVGALLQRQCRHLLGGQRGLLGQDREPILISDDPLTGTLPGQQRVVLLFGDGLGIGGHVVAVDRCTVKAPGRF
ncbi:conserved hypothetical protein [Ricinus communis]|uniref:Uncharacterized protein n=1 Tax=Ricinus communis TaxID=3988 RepID=B9TEN7_RICCO|nr:conserved hypothetical protein [Ricinus communis]